MDTGTGVGAGTPAGDEHALQPVGVVAGDLDEFSGTEATRRLERLEADRELVLQLALRGYEGLEWRQFAAALAEYGFQVIAAWTKSGAIFAKCTAKGLGLGAQDLSRSLDDAKELACETVAEAIRAFREKVLIPGRWDPTKGASLKTFFIGQCIFQFPNAFRRWIVEQDLAPVGADAIAHELHLRTAKASVETITEAAREVRRLRALPDDHPTRIRVLMELGYSQMEIAELLGTTEKAIQMKIYRHRHAGKGTR